MTHEDVERILASKKWHFAKTMANIPHCYARKREWGNDAEFFEVVKFLRQHSVPEKFWRKTYLYYHLNGEKYWTMDENVMDVEIINRAVA